MNSSLSVSARVALLLSNMTVDEKVAQLGYALAPCSSLRLRDFPHGIGGCSATSVSDTSTLRTELLESTRLGIPPSVYGETTHSGGALGTTVFPMPCSQGATWNVSL